MKIDLTFEELAVLETALDRTLGIMENELVHTDAPALQHELAADVRRVREVRELIRGQSRARPRMSPEPRSSRPSFDDRTL